MWRSNDMTMAGIIENEETSEMKKWLLWYIIMKVKWKKM